MSDVSSSFHASQLSPRQKALRQRAAELSDGLVREQAAETDRSESYPWPVVEALKEAGFFGMTLPEKWGGAGLGYLDAVLVIEQMARNCGVTARIVVEANMGAIGAIMAHGTAAQCARAAEMVLGGDKPAICITEPDAGSAATEMQTVAEKRPGGYLLNGTKHWITGGGVSRLHLIFARVREGGEDQGIGGFLAYRGETPGLEVGRREHAMGLRGLPETELRMQDMFIPDADVLQPAVGFRKGFGALMAAYNAQRVGAGTVALGLAQGAFERARDHLKTREQFGRPLAEFQGLQWMLADMQTGLTAARALIHMAAGSNVGGFPDKTLAAQAKLFASETAIRVTNDALQMFGARGYGRSLPLERFARDARMFTIGGGTAQMLRNQIAGSALGMKLPQTRDGYART